MYKSNNIVQCVGILISLVLFWGCNAALNTEQDVRDIRTFLQAWERTINAGDSTGYYALWTEDAVFMPDMGTATVGIDRIRSWAKYQFDNFDADATVSIDEVVASGDWGFARMEYKFRAFPKGGGGDPSPYLTGNAMWILERQSGGDWKIARYIFNTNEVAGDSEKPSASN